VLQGGWYLGTRTSIANYRNGVPVLTGFDVEIERALPFLASVYRQQNAILPDLWALRECR
jgi:hypothetical protein